MADLVSVLEDLRKQWSAPRAAVHRGEQSPFLLQCTFQSAAQGEEVAGRSTPADLASFWQYSGSARLFEDVTYGQWGLELFSPSDAHDKTKRYFTSRKKDARAGDLVVGGFLGDADLLVIRCDPTQQDFGSVMVALPVDERNEWYRVADRLSEFILRYASAEGDKYWEP